MTTRHELLTGITMLAIFYAACWVAHMFTALDGFVFGFLMCLLYALISTAAEKKDEKGEKE